MTADGIEPSEREQKQVQGPPSYGAPGTVWTPDNFSESVVATLASYAAVIKLRRHEATQR
jgi:hypothetical protein